MERLGITLLALAMAACGAGSALGVLDEDMESVSLVVEGRGVHWRADLPWGR